MRNKFGIVSTVDRIIRIREKELDLKPATPGEIELYEKVIYLLRAGRPLP